MNRHSNQQPSDYIAFSQAGNPLLQPGLEDDSLYGYKRRNGSTTEHPDWPLEQPDEDDRNPRTSHSDNKKTHVNVGEHPPPARKLKEWRSWKLSSWFNALVLMVELGFIIAIIILDRLSAHNDGIINVPNIEPSTGSLSLYIIPKLKQYYSLLWTSLPSLVFTLYSLTWATIVAASYERQPYIEIRRGHNARHTIMLDYRTYPGFYNWIIALIHKHILIGCAMFLGLLVSIVVVPLSAHLFVAGGSIHQVNVPLTFNTQFNESISIATTNLQPFIDIATSVHAYGSIPPAWMTVEYAFESFETTRTTDAINSANLSATTRAYSAYLDCNIVDSPSYIASYQDGDADSDNSSTGTVSITFTDRSCNIRQSFAVSSRAPTYGISWQADCEHQVINRLGIITGTYSSFSNSRLTDVSVISCIPSYWNTTGTLTVIQGEASSSTSNYVTFAETNSVAMQPEFSLIFEDSLHEYAIFDAADSSNTDSLGFSILSAAIAAANKDTTAAMKPDAIRNATERVFSTIYAGLATSVLLVPSENGNIGSGTLTKAINRLFLSRPIAYIIVIILILVLFVHVMLWIYALRHESILTEEPIGLLGSAILLEHSDVDVVLTKVRAKYGNNVEDVRKALKKGFSTKEARCFWDDNEARIKVEGLVAK